MDLNSTKWHWVGRGLSALVVLFLVFDGVMKFFMHLLPPEALEAGAALAFPMERMPTVGTILLISTVLYVIPKTSVLGAVLLTGYLGGAISLHLRVGNPLFSHLLFPVYVGIIVWAGLWLRNPEVRALMPVVGRSKK